MKLYFVSHIDQQVPESVQCFGISLINTCFKIPNAQQSIEVTLWDLGYIKTIKWKRLNYGFISHFFSKNKEVDLKV